MKVYRIYLSILCLFLSITTSSQAQDTLYWYGGTSTDWTTSTNWTDEPGVATTVSIPNSGTTVIFNTAATYDCVLDDDVSVAELVIVSGNSLDLNGYDLTTSGDLTQHDEMFQGGSGTITIGGQLHITGGEFHSTSGTLTVADGILQELWDTYYPSGGEVVITGATASVDMYDLLYDLEIASGAAVTMNNHLAVINSVTLNGTLNTNIKTFFVANADTGAISGSGGIILDIEDGEFGLCVWAVGEEVGNYVIPLWSEASSSAIPVEFNITTAGTGVDGSILLASAELNSSKPQDLLGDGLGYYKADGSSNADYNSNRVWPMVYNDYTVNPTLDITFHYDAPILSGISLDEGRMRAQVLNEAEKWSDYYGTVNTGADELVITDFTSESFGQADVWSLVDSSSRNYTTYGGKTGGTCAQAIDLDEDVFTNGYIEMADSVFWVTYEPENKTAFLALIFSYSDTADKIQDVRFYQDSCNSSQLGEGVIQESGVALYSGVWDAPKQYYAKLNKSGISMVKLSLEDGSFCKTESFMSIEEGIDCDFYLNYYPQHTTHDTTSVHFDTPIKYVRVAVHVMQSSDGTLGIPNNQSGIDFINNSIEETNRRFRELEVPAPLPTYPLDNPAISFISDARIQFIVTGIYFHQDDQGYNAHDGAGAQQLYNDYVESYNGLISDSSMCLFFRETRLDSNGNQINGGFAHYLTNSITSQVIPHSSSGNTYTLYQTGDFYSVAAVLAHELGHLLGLPHPWFSIEYDTIPNFSTGVYTGDTIIETINIDTIASCYDITVLKGHTNNIMDYHPSPNNSFTECQISTMHRNLITRDNLQAVYARELKSAFMYNPATGQAVDSSVNYCVKNVVPIEIEAYKHLVWDDVKNVNSDVVLKNGATLTIYCTVNMAKGTSFIVERGAKLIVDGGTITNSCGEFWQGIEVWGDPTTQHDKEGWIEAGNLSTYNQGVVYLINGATIENANVGIATIKEETWGANYDYSGGIILADSATFRNNKKAVGFGRFHEYGDGLFNQLNPNISYFKNCTFEITEDYLETAYTREMVTMWDVHGVTFENNLFINRHHTSSGGRGTGIYSESAEYFVMCESDSLNAACSGTTNRFENLDKGIHDKQVSLRLQNNLIIKGAEFENVSQPILMWGSMFPSAVLNDIDMGSIAKKYPSAIYFSGVLGGRIEDNDIELDASAWPYSRGVTVHTNYYELEVFNNTVSGASNSQALNAQMNNDGVVFKCNTIDDPMDHLVVYNNSSVNQLQGFCRGRVPANNRLASSALVNDFHLIQGQGSLYFEYHHSPDEPSIMYDPVSFWYLSLDTLLDVTCAVGLEPDTNYCDSRFIAPVVPPAPCGIYCREVNIQGFNTTISGLKAQLDGGDTEGLKLLASTTAMADNIITDSLLTYSGMLSDDVLLTLLYRDQALNDTMLSAILIDNSPHTNRVYREIEELDLGLPTDSMDKLITYQDSSFARKAINDSLLVFEHEKILEYYRLISENVGDTSINISRITDSLLLEPEPKLQLLLADLYIMAEEYYNAETVLNNIPLYSKELRDLVAVKLIVSEFADQGWEWSYIDSSSEAASYKDDLEALAFGDTTAGSQIALNILSSVADSSYETILMDIDTSGGSSKRGTVLSDEDKEQPLVDNIALAFKLYPNPAADKLTIEYELREVEETDEVYLQVYNLAGAQQLYFKLDLKKQSTTFDISDLDNGFYLYRIGMSKGTMEEGKLVILR